MTIVDTSIAAASAFFSGAAAWAAWKASQEANRTAATVAQIERDRWHNELTPQLRLRLEEDRNVLYVRFDGPAGLASLTVRLTLRDDRWLAQEAITVPAAARTAQEEANVIWGPFRFPPGTGGSDPLGRSIAPFVLEEADRIRLPLEPSLKPLWWEGELGEEAWRHRYRHARVRLRADCAAPGHKPWQVSFEVPRSGGWAQTGQPIFT
ncbi:hypothetical protein ABZ479_38355 [Streptomyces sp. NPDC005722]